MLPERNNPPISKSPVVEYEVNGQVLDRSTRFFRALADTPRVRLLARLAKGPAYVSDLAQAEGVTVPLISQRLRVLKDQKLVVSKRIGKRISYSLSDHEMLAAFEHVLHSIISFCPRGPRGRSSAHVEKGRRR
jgi:ArsR family transcriptional regulator